MSESIKQLDHRILQLCAPPQPKKKRLTSFHRFYTQSLEASPSWEHSDYRSLSAKKYNAPIDDFLVEKIETLAPSKIGRQFEKRKTKSQKLKSESQLYPQYSSKYDDLIEKYRKKSLEVAKKAALHEYRVKRKSSKPPRKELALEVREIKWVERRWDTQGQLGKHSEKLHPICLVYEECAEQVSINCRSPPNPFEGYEPLDL
jgi:hypothetical protein